MNPDRRAAITYAKLRAEGALASDERGDEFLRVECDQSGKPKSTQTVAIISLREMLIPITEGEDVATYR